MLPPRIAALAIVALVIAAMTGLIVVIGTGAFDTGAGQRGVGDATTSRPVVTTSRSTPTSVASSVESSKPAGRPTPSVRPTRSATPTSAPSRTATPNPPSAEPNTVAIRAQGVLAPIGVCAVVDRALLPPSEVGRTCRWSGGADLSARSGTTVLVGEAQWADRGPAAFGRIGQLAAGEHIVTYDGGGVATRWRVVEVFRRAKSDGVDLRAFVDGTGPRQLYLISAGGRFDGSRRAFLDNVYVRAVPDLSTWMSQ